MTRLEIFLAGLLAALLLPGVAWAQNPHFLTATAALQEDGRLKFCFKEAGLGNEAVATATYRCVNNGGNCPQAPTKGR